MNAAGRLTTASVDFAALEQHLLDARAAPHAPDERSYYDCWHAHQLNQAAPAAAALGGALLADRLPWAFAAGYQATLRNAFPVIPPDGWAAFVANEDRDNPERFPATTLRETDDGLVLNGCKLWVAHSRLVDHLLVTVNDPGGDKYRARGVLVPRERAGIALTHREKPAFLAAMSQGFARFDDVRIHAGEVFEFEPIRLFGRTEAKFVMLALSAFMLARLGAGADRDRVLTIAAALVSLLGERDTSRCVYAAIEREFQACVETFERRADLSAIPDYAADRRVMEMYSARIQRREGYARADAGRS